MMRAHKINIFVFVLLASLFVAPFAFAEEAATGDGTDAAGDPTATAGTQSEGGASGEADAGQGDDTQGVELGSVGCTGPDSCTDGNVCRDGVCVAADSTGSTGGASGSGSTGAGGTGKSGTGFVAIAPIPGLTEGAIANESGIANFLNNLYKYAIGLSAVLAVIMIIWGGLEYATQDSPGGKKSGKERIQQAILGLILILAPALVFSIINPAILNLSVNLPPLDTKSGPATPQTQSLPPCIANIRTTNCDSSKTVNAPTRVDFYGSPQKGQWCFGRTDPRKADSALEYVCYDGSQSKCEADQKLQTERDGAKFVTFCKQY